MTPYIKKCLNCFCVFIKIGNRKLSNHTHTHAFLLTKHLETHAAICSGIFISKLSLAFSDQSPRMHFLNHL